MFFSAPEEIIFEITSETPLRNDFLSAPEEIIFETISEFRWKNSAPEGILFEIMSATPQVNVFFCARGNIFRNLFRKSDGEGFFNAPEEVLF